MFSKLSIKFFAKLKKKCERLVNFLIKHTYHFTRVAGLKKYC